MKLSYLIALSAGTAEHNVEMANLTTDPLPSPPTGDPLNNPEIDKSKKKKKERGGIRHCLCGCVCVRE